MNIIILGGIGKYKSTIASAIAKQRKASVKILALQGNDQEHYEDIPTIDVNDNLFVENNCLIVDECDHEFYVKNRSDIDKLRREECSFIIVTRSLDNISEILWQQMAFSGYEIIYIGLPNKMLATEKETTEIYTGLDLLIDNLDLGRQLRPTIDALVIVTNAAIENKPFDISPSHAVLLKRLYDALTLSMIENPPIKRSKNAPKPFPREVIDIADFG